MIYHPSSQNWTYCYASHYSLPSLWWFQFQILLKNHWKWRWRIQIVPYNALSSPFPKIPEFYISFNACRNMWICILEFYPGHRRNRVPQIGTCTMLMGRTEPWKNGIFSHIFGLIFWRYQVPDFWGNEMNLLCTSILRKAFPFSMYSYMISLHR